MRTILNIGRVSLLLPRKANAAALFAALGEAVEVERDFDSEREAADRALGMGARDFRNRYRPAGGIELSIEKADDDQFVMPKPRKPRKQLLLTAPHSSNPQPTEANR